MWLVQRPPWPPHGKWDSFLKNSSNSPGGLWPKGHSQLCDTESIAQQKRSRQEVTRRGGAQLCVVTGCFELWDLRQIAKLLRDSVSPTAKWRKYFSSCDIAVRSKCGNKQCVVPGGGWTNGVHCPLQEEPCACSCYDMWSNRRDRYNHRFLLTFPRAS